MTRILKIVLGLVGVSLLALGIMWLMYPEVVAEALDMPLAEGRGLSTQIGDLAAFFTAAGVLVLIGTTTGKRHWLYAPALLMGLTAVFRVIAWVAHGAALFVVAIAVEVAITVLLLYSARRIRPAA